MLKAYTATDRVSPNQTHVNNHEALNWIGERPDFLAGVPAFQQAALKGRNIPAQGNALAEFIFASQDFRSPIGSRSSFVGMTPVCL